MIHFKVRVVQLDSTPPCYQNDGAALLEQRRAIATLPHDGSTFAIEASSWVDPSNRIAEHEKNMKWINTNPTFPKLQKLQKHKYGLCNLYKIQKKTSIVCFLEKMQIFEYILALWTILYFLNFEYRIRILCVFLYMGT